MNIDVDLMLTIVAGIILAQIISYGFSLLFSSGNRFVEITDFNDETD